MATGKRKVQRPGAVRGAGSVSRAGAPLEVPVYQTCAGYVITRPRLTDEGFVELDGALIADAARMASEGMK